MLCYTWGTFKERIGKHYEKNGIMRCVHALVRLFGWIFDVADYFICLFFHYLSNLSQKDSLFP